MGETSSAASQSSYRPLLQRDELDEGGGDGSNDSRSLPSSSRRSSITAFPPVYDEESPLLTRPPSDGHANDDAREGKLPLTWTVMSILLLGEFIAHADTTLIFASAAQIASQLGSLRSASWLAAAYTLAVCSTQPLCGRLCDIFGRKAVLMTSYTILGTGCVLCGLSTTLWQIILGRIISGIGGAGVMTMASIIITDSVEKRDIARYRSYINMATTIGRSVGGPLGGCITDRLGWPWLFYLRIPIFVISVVLLIPGLETQNPTNNDGEPVEDSLREKLAKVDFIGAFLLSSSIVALVLLIGGIGTLPKVIIAPLVCMAGVSANFFALYEVFVCKTPILDLRILTKPNVTLSYVINYLQVVGQVGMMFSVPMYFEVTQRASTTAAGSHLVPAVVANTAGALFAGKVIQRTQMYKSILVGTGLFGTITYVLMFLRWNGNTSGIESLYIVPAGFATGAAQSAAFVSMASCLDSSKVAMATGVYFLTSSIGTASGITITNTLMTTLFQKGLESRLPGPGNAEVIHRVVEDIEYIDKLQGRTRDLVVQAFVASLKSTYALGIGLGIVASCLALRLRHVKL